MKKHIIIAVIFLLAIPLEWLLILPKAKKIPADFHYEANVFSLDNFYNEQEQRFSGEMLSKTKFSYDVIDQNGDILIVKNLFDVRKPTGEKIFSVERLYGIDPTTGQHSAGYGDHDRNGYLFAPIHTDKQDFYYWHINYDVPALMKFQAEEVINELKVQRYQCVYHSDQTSNLGFLPGVGKERGVELDITLTIWIEPETGRMIKYEDYTTAWYYDIYTKKRINPWNKFHNEYAYASVMEQVKNVNNLHLYFNFLKIYLPILFMILAFIVLMLGYARK